MTEEEIGYCVRMALAKADIRAPKLAEQMGVTRQTAHAITKGKNDSIKKLSRVAEICGMSFREMIDLLPQEGSKVA